ncbi:hypothetical protein FRC15_009877 [Serendipita sp. 397]|nr:hypothetical protein FRC15_009877 [Serendipita sp. 397]
MRRSWGTYNGTIDSFLSHLQLVHFRHFQHPATFLWADPSTALETLFDESGDIHDSIHQLGDSIKRLLNTKTASRDALLHSIREATDQFQRSISASRQSFLVLLETQRYLSTISPQSNATELRISFLELLALFGDGKLETTCGKILQRVQLLTGPQLLELIDRLQKWDGDLIQVDTSVSTFLSRIGGLRNAVEDTLDPMREETKNKHPLSEKVALHLRELWDPMGAWMASPLLRVWRTVETELPIDILNPNMRDTVLSALIHPENYLLHDASQFIKVQPAPPTTVTPSKSKRGGKGKGKKKKAEKVEEEEEEEPVHNPDLNPDPDPDISILFSRYANAGRTINLYDWFESFAQGLEAARPSSPPPPSTRTNSTKPNGQGKARRGGEETRKREYYARSMWSLHAMDMLGLVRWGERGAGKKGAECVGKTVWITRRVHFWNESFRRSFLYAVI